MLSEILLKVDYPHDLIFTTMDDITNFLNYSFEIEDEELNTEFNDIYMAWLLDERIQNILWSIEQL
jgi:hypothetical protein